MSKPWTIYSPSDPRTSEVRYVGKTVNVDERMRGYVA